MTVLSLRFEPFPDLSTDRLLLRSVTPDDAPEIFFLRSDPRVMKFFDRAPAASLEEAEVFIRRISEEQAKADAVTWAITSKEAPSSKLIGTICFWNIQREHARADIGYALHPDHQRRGLMQEALVAVTAYGFETMKLHSIAANVNPANQPSIALLERAGFVREAHFRENYFYDGRFLDTAIYSLLTPARKIPGGA